MRLSKGAIIGVVILVVVIVLIGLRIYYNTPKKLPTGHLLESFELTGREYRIKPKISTTIGNLVDTTIFEGYSPSKHLEYESQIENNPSKFVKEDKYNHYMEYVSKYGRMQFHSEFSEDVGIKDWFEFIPDNLTIDKFFNNEISIYFDIEKRITIYIYPIKNNNTYMTIYAQRGKIEKIAWLEF